MSCAMCRRESAVDISEEIDQLSKKSQQLTKDIYSASPRGRSPRSRATRSGRITMDYVGEIFHRLHRTAR